MHHRIAAFLLGCWILGSLFMMFVATQNFQTVDRVLAAPPPDAQQMIQTLGPAPARSLLRYLAGQENQLFFNSWEAAQLFLGAALAGILFFGAHNKLLAGLAGGLLILTLVQHFEITPQMIALSRSMNVQSAPPEQFWKLHALYGGTEVLKLLIALAAAVLLLPAWRSGSRASIEVPAVKYAR
jgi:hypothetical protein